MVYKYSWFVVVRGFACGCCPMVVFQALAWLTKCTAGWIQMADRLPLPLTPLTLQSRDPEVTSDSAVMQTRERYILVIYIPVTRLTRQIRSLCHCLSLLLKIPAPLRQVTIMVDSGKELGISIRGGSEHGLGIYISKVEEASVAEAYGIKVWWYIRCMI